MGGIFDFFSQSRLRKNAALGYCFGHLEQRTMQRENS
jgi:hypothetical protein